VRQDWPKVAYSGSIYVLVERYDKFWPYSFLHYQFLPISTLSGRFDHNAIKIPSKCNLARNGQQWYNMSCYSEVCPFMATFDAAQLILVNFGELSLNGQHIFFDDRDLQTLANTASNSPVWSHLVNGDKVWSRIWSMYDFVHIEAEVRNLGLRYQVMAGMALWGKIEQNWPKVAYNGLIYV